MKTTLSLALSLFICTTAYSQNTWIVDQSGAGNFTEIQLAIDSFNVFDGDEIIVKDGTYPESINFNTKELLIRSENGPLNCILTGGSSINIVSLENGEAGPTELRGFSINGGFSKTGVYCFNYVEAVISGCVVNECKPGARIEYGSNITMLDTVISNCRESSSYWGAGVSLEGSNLITRDSQFVNNSGGSGGAIGINGGGSFNLFLDNIIFDSNTVATGGHARGGAIRVETQGGDVVIENSYFINNTATSSGNNYSANGGAIYSRSNINVSNCVFDSSKTLAGGYRQGGAIYTDTASTTIIDCQFIANQGGGGGGAIHSARTAEILNCLFDGNSSNSNWGATTHPSDIYAGADSILSNVTSVNRLTGNYSIDAGATSSITNSILRGASPLTNSATTYSCVEGGYQGVGNISVDPVFVSGTQGDYYLSQPSSGQLLNSPCVNSGNPNSTLIDGTTRTDETNDGGTVDMGYHYNGDNYDPNNAPVAGNDTASTIANSDVVISVLLNDSDADGDTLSVVSVTTPLNGTATLNGDDVTYSPLLDWSGIDTFTYDVSDGNGGVSTATVTVTVDAPPTLNITPIIPGGIVNVTITGSAPRGTFILCWSFNGAGPTPIGGTNLNLSLSPPIRTAAPFMLDANGDGAMNPVNVPNWLTPGTGMWFQGAVIDIAGGSGVTLSNALDMVVQ